MLQCIHTAHIFIFIPYRISKGVTTNYEFLIAKIYLQLGR